MTTCRVTKFPDDSQKEVDSAPVEEGSITCFLTLGEIESTKQEWCRLVNCDGHYLQIQACATFTGKSFEEQ
jgi:hypothetical protein